MYVCLRGPEKKQKKQIKTDKKQKKTEKKQLEM